LLDAVDGVSELRRVIVGLSGSSAGALVVDVVDVDEGVDAVVVVESLGDALLSELRRFIVGRSGSSAGAVVLLVVEDVADPELAVVPDAVVVVVPELAVSGLRRFMVGRSGSSLVEGVAGLVVAEVVPDLLSVAVVGLAALLSEAVEESLAGFEPKCGRLASFEAVITGTFFDGFSAVDVLFGAARGLTLP
jgi:hypothetical protein